MLCTYVCRPVSRAKLIIGALLLVTALLAMLLIALLYLNERVAVILLAVIVVFLLVVSVLMTFPSEEEGVGIEGTDGDSNCSHDEVPNQEDQNKSEVQLKVKPVQLCSPAKAALASAIFRRGQVYARDYEVYQGSGSKGFAAEIVPDVEV